MAVRFRLADSARENMESLRAIMRRRAAGLMAGIVLGFGILLWVTKVFIAPPPVAEFEVYNHVVEDDVLDKQDKPKDLSAKQPSSPPITPTIIVSPPTTNATFTLDIDMPDITDNSSPSDSLVGGDGLGDGGIGKGDKGGMGGGTEMKSSFLGVFYDFKKKSDGKESPLGGRSTIYNGEVLNLESRFYNKAWSLLEFAPYFRAKQRLYATCFYMPNCMDREASHAYDPSGKYGLKPGRWVAVYRARVKAPSSGKFRFVGVADSVMAVRFDGKNVLACGLHNLKNAGWNEWFLPANPEAGKGRELFAFRGCEFWNEQTGGFVAGEPFTVKADQWYEMQVLVSEIGGGEFGFCLLIDDMTSPEKKTTKDGKPLFQLFRTAFSSPNAKDTYETIMYKEEDRITDPPYDEDSMIWEAKPVDPDVRMK